MERSPEHHARVRDILMREWNAIVAPRDVGELGYDGTAARAYAMLMEEKAGAIALGAYLFDIATGAIGHPPSHELAGRCARTAATLTELRPEFDPG